MDPVFRRTFLDDGRQRELEERGFTIVEILSEAEAAAALERVQALRPSDGFAPGEDSLARYHCTFLDPDRDYRRAVDELTRSLFEERACALLDDFWMLTSNLYVKPPGTGRFEIHQNWPVTDDIRDTTLTLWCPFVDAGPHNGCIQVVPGSHKIVPDTFTVGAPKYFQRCYDELIERWLEPVPLRAGECILFDDSLLHWSESNQSESARWSAQLVLMPKEKVPVVYHYDRSHQPPQFELYEVGPDFFIDYEVGQLIERPEGLRLVGTMPENNLDIDEAVFTELMAAGPQTRSLVYAHEPLEVAFAGPVARAAEALAAPAPTAVSESAPADPSTDGAVPDPEPEVPAAASAPPAAPARRRWWPFRR